MTKLKIGDKVTLTTTFDIKEFNLDLEVGDVGTVTDLDGYYTVRFDRVAPKSFQFEAFELKLVS